MKAIVALIAFLFCFFYINPVFTARSLTITVNKNFLFGEEVLVVREVKQRLK